MVAAGRAEKRRKLTNPFRFLEKMDSENAVAYCILLALVVLAVDYITGKDIQFPILYVFPSGIAAWKNKKTTAYTLAILMPLARIWFHIPWHEMENIYLEVINAIVIIMALTLFVYLVNRTSLQEIELQKRVKVLEGILPICASCKRIRNEKNEYEQLERYITEHSEAMFSHGICPECMKKLYSGDTGEEND
jgi:hypothetical protein